MGIEVRAQDGRVWEVDRQLRWPRWRSIGANRWNDLLEVPLWLPDSGIGSLLVGLAIALLFGILIIAFLPLVVFVVEAAIVVIAALAFRRPWLVIARTIDSPAEERRWRVRGSLASRRAVREVAAELERGVNAAPELAN